MRRITAGNDAPFRWAVTLQGKPFDLTGKDVKVYVINSRGEIPVAQLTIEGHEVSGVFEGRYQTRLGEHSLVLRVNEGRPEMKTAAVANVFELVQWSADAGGSNEGDVIVAPVLIESELSIGGGSLDMKSPFTPGSAQGSALQTIEAETFTDKNEISSTYGQEVKAEASGDYSLALGGDAAATAKRAVAQGHRCIARGETSHAEGHCAVVEYIDETFNGYGAHAEGYSTFVAGSYSHVEGSKCVVTGSNSHAEGGETAVMADMAHADGYKTVVELGADGAHAEGNGTIADAKYSHVEGRQTKTYGEGAHAEGTETEAHEDYSHAEGNSTKSKGLYSHTEGISTETNAAGAHAEGFETHANNECSHAEGHGAVASGIYAHAEGWVANAIGEAAHAEGQNTRAHQIGSHSEGNNTDAKGPYSHAEGIGTKTKEGIAGQHVEGYYNKETDSLKVIGCGTSDDDRKNAVEVTQDGRVFVKGVGNFDGTNSNEAADLKHAIDNKANSGDVYNKTELDNRLKADFVQKSQLATINGKSIIEGGNIVIEGGSSATPDWNASEGEEGFIKNRTHYKKQRVDVIDVNDIYYIEPEEDENGDIIDTEYAYFYGHYFNASLEIAPQEIYFSINGQKSEPISVIEGEIFGEVEMRIDHKQYATLYIEGHVEDQKGITLSLRVYCEYELSSLQVCLDSTTIKKIDEKFIPDTIARVASTEKTANKVTSISERSTHTQYPSAKAVYNALQELASRIEELERNL